MAATATAAPPRRRGKKPATAAAPLEPSAVSQQIADGAVASAAADLQNRAVCLALRFGVVGLQRKVETERAMKVDVADPGAVLIAKVLYDGEELDAIKSIDSEIRRYVELKALPSLFKNGVYLLPIVSVEEAERDLADFAARRRIAVDQFCAAYDRIVADGQERLGDLHDPGDYPGVEAVRSSFAFGWRYVQYGIPGALADISQDLFEKEKRKAANQWEEALENARSVLRQGMAQVVSHAVERLTDSADGKRKIFRDSVLENINEFLGAFDPKNTITNDAELKALVEQTRGIVSGVDLRTLRDDAAARKSVRDGFEAVKLQLDSMLVNKPARAFSLEDV